MLNETHSSTRPSNSLPASQPHRLRRRRRRGRRPGNKPAGFRQEISAGGIIYRRTDGSVEIFFIKDPFGRWTFPKGHQERGETTVQTAVREIKEETGLDHLTFIAPLGRTSFRFRRQGVVIQKTVYIFLFEAPKGAKEHLTGEGAIFEGKWASPSEVFSVSGYKNLDKLLARALRHIAQIAGNKQRATGNR